MKDEFLFIRVCLDALAEREEGLSPEELKGLISIMSCWTLEGEK